MQGNEKVFIGSSMNRYSFLFHIWKWGWFNSSYTKSVRNVDDLFVSVSSTNTDSTKSNYSDDSEVDETESTSYMESDSKNFTICQMNASNTETADHSFHDSNQVILTYPHDQQQHYITSDQSDTNKSIVVSKADTISHSHENQCHMHKGDNNFISLNYFLMDVQLQMGKLNDLAQMELKIEIQKMILEKLRKAENLKND